MRAEELARDLRVEPDAMLHLLREMGIAVADVSASVSDADASRVLARIERERRAGKKDNTEAVVAATEEAATGQRRRRRRRAPEPAPEPEVDEEALEIEGEGEVEAAEVDEAPADEEAAPVEAVDDVEVDVAAEPEPGVEVVQEVEVADEPESSDEEAAAEASDEASDEVAVIGEPLEPAAAADEDQPPAAKPEPVRTGAPDGPVRVIRKPAPAASAGPGGTVRVQAEGYTTDGHRKRKDKKKKRGRVDQDAVQENLQRVMAELKAGGGKKKRRKGERVSREALEARELEQEEEREREATIVRVNEFLTIAELAELMDVPAAQIVGSAFKNLGLMVTINQRLDFGQIELLLDEFGFTAVREEAYVSDVEDVVEDEDDPETLKPRPAVVTVMGHVDHGKTLLLDRIRSTNVVAGESGGITQHIGAYHVELPDQHSVTFLDTPGHAAFTAMRARGADVTDVVILIVAADDSVMPQTIEAISHAKNAGVPLVVAVNKTDLPAANPGRVKQELLQHDVQVEEFGGSVLSAEVSAKSGDGIDDLLEKVVLQSEMLELSANPDREAQGTVIEAQLDVGKGPVVTVLVQRGTLRVGDDFLVGLHGGRVRAMLDERGNPVDEVGPGIPAQVLGAGGVPQAGDTFQVMDAVRAAELSNSRQRLEREKQLRIKERGVKLGDFSRLRAEGQVDMLPLIIKADVDGSVQALSDALELLGTSEVQVEVIHRGVGAVNESDVLLAETAGAVIIAFRVRPDSNSRTLAERSGVDIQTYEVIYNAVDDVRAALEGMLAPEQREEILGSAEVRETFKITKVGTIGGCYVTHGVMDRKSRARVVRDGMSVYDGEFASLKRFKDDVKEVREGFECGIGIQNFNDVKVGDVIECYRVEEIARTLASSAAAEERG